MTQQPAAGVAGSVSCSENESPLSSTPPDVSQVLFQRAVRQEPTADTSEWEQPPLFDPIARRLDELVGGFRPPFDIPVGIRHPTIAAAVACPDLFLLGAQGDERGELAMELIETIVRGDQRVLVISHDPDSFVERFGGSAARAVGADESIDRLPPAIAGRTATALAVAERVATRDRLTAQILECQDRMTAIERWEADEAAIRAELDRVAERAAIEVPPPTETGERAELTRELADLQVRTQPPGGFFRKLFGMAKPDESTAKRVELETKLRDLDQANRAESQLRITVRVDELRTECEAKLTRHQHERPSSAETVETVRREFTRAQELLAEIDARPPVLSAGGKDQIRVVIGPPTAVGFDPLLSASHPEAAPRFDRVIWTDADGVSEHEFGAIARLGAAWILIGNPTPGHPTALRNGTLNGVQDAKPGPVFAKLWDALHETPWTTEGDRPLVRLRSVPSDRRSQLTCEPLFGRPDVEIRFADTETGPELAEVLFPTGMTLAEAKAFLAAESDEVRLMPIGAAHWHETPEVITCCWPVAEANTPLQSADLNDGVLERVCPFGWTAAVSFVTSAGWTRESAADWLTARTPTTSPRSALVH